MRGRHQLSTVVLVLLFLTGASTATGIVAGQGDGHTVTPDTDPAQQAHTQENNRPSANTTRVLSTVRTTVEETVVHRNASVNVTAHVQNRASHAITEPLTLSIDGEDVVTHLITVPANTTSRLVFVHLFTEIGVHSVSVGNESTLIGITEPKTALPQPDRVAARPPTTTAADAGVTMSPRQFLALLGAGGFVAILVFVLAVRYLLS